ncbi:MAG TPA: proton-conducting transporter membrane subunit, partial [Methylomirabilota bacterium]
REETVTALDGLLRADALSAWMVALIGIVASLAGAEVLGGWHGGSAEASRRFYPLFHLFVFTMLLAVTTDDLGLMWVAVEGTTLASVFLVNFHRTRASLEAAYKYLLICSVGIALAFVGTVFVYFADAQRLGAETHALRWTTLLRWAPMLPPRVLELAFVFLLVGYGTKAGLAPMHTWLPDAHSEAPAPISALMSGVLLSVGIYAVLRFKTVVDLAAGPGFSRRLLVLFGLGSMAVAAAFLWSPTNFKRMLAYSSVEHLGLVCLGLGFGGIWGVAGAALHLGNHALAKSVLFLLSGRIRDAYGTVEIPSVRGLLVTMPVTGRGFFVALLALLGLPPFGLFISELLIFGAGFREGWGFAAALGLVLLLIAFGGLLRALHHMAYGVSGGLAPQETLTWKGVAPIAVALSLLVLTGTAWPPGLAAALERVVAVMGG